MSHPARTTPGIVNPSLAAPAWTSVGQPVASRPLGPGGEGALEPLEAASASRRSTRGVLSPRSVLAILLAASSQAAAQAPGPQRDSSLAPVGPSQLLVESGAVEPAGQSRFTLRKPVIRALAPGTTGSAARLRFTYRGQSDDTAPLASGELRRQIGIKLSARDTCNVLYVMWHIEPSSGIAVQLKSNPEQRTHAECRDHGYRTLEAQRRRVVAPINADERHELAASIDGGVLKVVADGQVAWEGILPGEVSGLEGPVGLRSDNGTFEVELWAAKR